MADENVQRVAVITGGTSGIGFATAQKFVEQGFRVVLVARSREGLATAKQRLAGSGAEVLGVRGDLSAPGNVPAVAEEVLSAAERMDVFVNNAGLSKFAPVTEYREQDYDALFDFNVKVPFLLIRAFLPRLVQHQGSIVNVSTYWAHKMVRGRYSSLYSASRGAMASMVRALANELADQGVRVNAVAPGSTETEAFVRWRDSLGPEARNAFTAEVARSYPLRCLGRPEDIAEAVVFLASEKARWMTGQTINVDGGFTIR